MYQEYHEDAVERVDSTRARFLPAQSPPTPIPSFWLSLESRRVYLTDSVHKVVLEKSIPAQIRQLILYHYSYEEQVDECVRDSCKTTV